MEQGVGNLTEEPTVRLTWSDDGGRTFSDEIFRTLGKIGNYKRRCIWYRLGRAPRYRIFRFEFSDKFKFSATRLDMIIKGGRNG